MKNFIFCLLLVCLGCARKPDAPRISINMIDNNHAVKFKGLDYAIVSEITRDSVPDIWENLLPVYRMPVDTDLKNYQPVQHGLYQLKDSAVVFIPDTPFMKGQAYFMRYYQFGHDDEIWDFIKGKKRLRSLHYIDLTFN